MAGGSSHYPPLVVVVASVAVAVSAPVTTSAESSNKSRQSICCCSTPLLSIPYTPRSRRHCFSLARICICLYCAENSVLVKKLTFPPPLSTTAVSIFPSFCRDRLCYPTSLPACSYISISSTDLVFHPCYSASPPPPLSSSRVYTVVFITSPSIVPHPSLPLWSCIYAVSPLPLFLTFPHLYRRRPYRTCHLLLHWYYPVRLHCRNVCLAFIVLFILLPPPFIIFCHCTAPPQLMSPPFHISTSHQPASILSRSILPYF